MKRTPRGQATLELALGMMIFVTVLMVGIHFAEVGYLSLKVTEAADAALFDTTAMQMHQWPNDVSPATASAATAASEVQTRYANFDGRLSQAGSTGISQVLTDSTGMTVTCTVGGGPNFGPDIHVDLAYEDEGGLSCQANASIGSIRMASHFLDGVGGIFHVDQSKTLQDIPVCAIGRASGGSCPGKVQMMIDDWGLSGPSEGGTCEMTPDIPMVSCSGNSPYWNMALTTYVTNGLALGASGSSLATFTVGSLPFPFFPGGENMFWMSATGDTELFTQLTGVDSLGGFLGHAWTTTPGGIPGVGLVGGMYAASYFMRSGCFLGKGC